MWTYTQGDVPLISEGPSDDKGFNPNESFCISDKVSKELTDPSPQELLQDTPQDIDSPQGADPEEPPSFNAENNFVSPKESRLAARKAENSVIGKRNRRKRDIYLHGKFGPEFSAATRRYSTESGFG
ncbi:hypothetical protein FOPG_19877 [Fusarium oxysporum f. sp. conglutinans race 2 54008]|uniref:Uncharacterized protein n=1 Tax=Fusarium oxysporum f. sp. conglutinans race 2 54008 TaxID=1089457 RepID=X0GVM0_FUSOX|nr:hypothetical protein FOPG_19877 [Fusarium oxysporum f. sp. conglutinans race 2 54008]